MKEVRENNWGTLIKEHYTHAWNYKRTNLKMLLRGDNIQNRSQAGGESVRFSQADGKGLATRSGNMAVLLFLPGSFPQLSGT